jgi:hypothetical protein
MVGEGVGFDELLALSTEVPVFDEVGTLELLTAAASPPPLLAVLSCFIFKQDE